MENTDNKVIAVKEMIGAKMAALGINDAELARRTGINPRRIKERREEPEKMRLEELWRIMDVLKPEEYYKERMF